MSRTKIILGLGIGAVIFGFSFIWFGVFNVAANVEHWKVSEKFFELVRVRSIVARAGNITVPDLTDKARVKRGAGNYAAMCSQCHLAPGTDTSELYEGLNPAPPVLYKYDKFTDKPSEKFWVIKNGIRMTGMPGWGTNNSDEQIWDMIALISALKDMTPKQYLQLVESGEHTHKNGGHGSSSSMKMQDNHQTNSGGTKAHKEPMKKKQAGHNDDGHAH